MQLGPLGLNRPGTTSRRQLRRQNGTRGWHERPARTLSRDEPQRRKIVVRPPTRLEFDWLQGLINITLLIAVVAFLLTAGIMAWTLY